MSWSLTKFPQTVFPKIIRNAAYASLSSQYAFQMDVLGSQLYKQNHPAAINVCLDRFFIVPWSHLNSWQLPRIHTVIPMQGLFSRGHMSCVCSCFIFCVKTQRKVQPRQHRLQLGILYYHIDNNDVKWLNAKLHLFKIMLKKLFGKLFKVHITAFLKHSEAFYKGLILT